MIVRVCYFGTDQAYGNLIAALFPSELNPLNHYNLFSIINCIHTIPTLSLNEARRLWILSYSMNYQIIIVISVVSRALVSRLLNFTKKPSYLEHYISILSSYNHRLCVISMFLICQQSDSQRQSAVF